VRHPLLLVVVSACGALGCVTSRIPQTRKLLGARSTRITRPPSTYQQVARVPWVAARATSRADSSLKLISRNHTQLCLLTWSASTFQWRTVGVAARGSLAGASRGGTGGRPAAHRA
jgi:hypothetical protein